MNLKAFREKIAWKGFRSLEFKALFFAMRAAAALACFVYILSSASGAWTWAQIKHVRMYDLSAVDAVVRSGDIAFAEKWISYRPMSESAELLARVMPLSPQLPSLIFFNLSRRAEGLGDHEQARVLQMVGRFRLRYDMLRCGMPDTDEAVNYFLKLFSIFDPIFASGLTREESFRLARKALEFDTRYPAANDPARLCWILNRVRRTNYEPVPRDKWEKIRFALRYVSDLTLTRDEAEMKVGQGTGPRK